MIRLSAEPPGIPDLESMTKRELLEYAEENGISGVDSSMRKADIYNNITAKM